MAKASGTEAQGRRGLLAPHLTGAAQPLKGPARRASTLPVARSVTCSRPLLAKPSLDLAKVLRKELTPPGAVDSSEMHLSGGGGGTAGGGRL
jgi:hypothetical protein